MEYTNKINNESEVRKDKITEKAHISRLEEKKVYVSKNYRDEFLVSNSFLTPNLVADAELIQDSGVTLNFQFDATKNMYYNDTLYSSTTETLKYDFKNIKSENKLTGYVTWHGIDVPYSASTKYGVSQVLYTRAVEGKTYSEEEKADGKRDGYEYRIQAIDSDTNDIMMENSWIPIAVLGATAEDCGEVYSEGGFDRFIGLTTISNGYDWSVPEESTLKYNTGRFGLKQYGHTGSTWTDTTFKSYCFDANHKTLTKDDGDYANIKMYSGKSATEYFRTIHEKVQDYKSLDNVGQIVYSGSTVYYQIEDAETPQLYWESGVTMAVKETPTTSNTAPAAVSTYFYTTEGTEKGDWYLPAFGEIYVTLFSYSGIDNNYDIVKESFDQLENSTDMKNYILANKYGYRTLINGDKKYWVKTIFEGLSQNGLWTSTPILNANSGTTFTNNDALYCHGYPLRDDYYESRNNTNTIRPFLMGRFR